jgi:Ni,Fe-hydrogenase III large subunit
MTRDDIPLATLRNGDAVPLESIPSLTPEDLTRVIRDGIGIGLRVSAYFGVAGVPGRPARSRDGAPELYLVLADDERNRLYAGRARVESGGFPSVAATCPQVQLFEREIAEQLGLVPEGHPWLKPVRYARSWTGKDVWGRAEVEPILPGAAGVGVSGPGVQDFYRVEGEQVHEVAVGPVHAGVIEPGHFRFQCHGERVFHLEIALGYQHRGVEEALIGGPDRRSIHYAETASGDATIGHASSYCQVLEALARCNRPARAQALGAIALELERLANHVGDLGALSGDVGYLPTASFCGRIRGDFLNMTALLCGNRFGRGLVRPGGLGYDADDDRVRELARRVAAAERDTMVAVKLLLDTQSVLARFEDTGRLGRETAVALGAVGPAARASGLSRDVRFDQPSGMYRLAQIPMSTYDSGDVLGRAFVRYLEIQQSLAFIREQLDSIPAGPVSAELGPLSPNSLAVALNEAWRGEACHVALTDGEGAFARYKIVDPSFHNWPALAYALRDQEISDFPICNKSFSLSYCGHDL